MYADVNKSQPKNEVLAEDMWALPKRVRRDLRTKRTRSRHLGKECGSVKTMDSTIDLYKMQGKEDDHVNLIMLIHLASSRYRCNFETSGQRLCLNAYVASR